MTTAMFALVDCNNFYVSCERVFNPKITGKPVIVLSNNDGCVIARSEEAKAIGIRMAEPSFLIKDFLVKNNVQIFSANYALYGDLSARVMQTLKSIVPGIEIYSIDEAFLDISGIKVSDLNELAFRIKKTVWQWTGIPVSIGIAATKTLAKLANESVKKMPEKNGVFILENEKTIQLLLEKTKVKDIWGVGEQYGQFLEKQDVLSAWQLRNSDESWIRKHMTVMGVRTVRELKGESCIRLEMGIPDKKGIMTARSFGKEVDSYDELKEAVATFTARSAEKLRAQKSCCSNLMVFLNTNRFRPDKPQYNNYELLKLPVPTDNTMELISFALKGLKKIWRKEFKYKKAGVFLSEIVPGNQIQTNIFDENDRQKAAEITLAVDSINRLIGRDKVRFAVQGFDRKWRLKQEKLSPNYTTNWDDIPIVIAK